MASQLFVLLLLALWVGGQASTFDGELFSADYYRWFYRWHRGGAWVAHQETHECFGTISVCKFVPRNNTQFATLKLAVNTTLVEHLAWVEVTFSPDSIANHDLVAVYLVDSEESNDVEGDPLSDFVDYVYANESRVLDSGVHSIVFGPLVNMRASYQFKYLREVAPVDADRPVFSVLGESPFVEMVRGHTEPLQIRLDLTGNAGEMRVTWISGQIFGPSVRFGPAASGGLQFRAEATTVTYDALDMCSGRATTRSSVFFRHPGYIHQAVMTELIPGQKYIYRVGSATGVSSPAVEFTFPTALGDRSVDNQRPQSFFVFGDLGTSVLQRPTGELDFSDTNPERHFTSRDMVSRLANWGDERTVMQRIQQDFDDASQSTALPDTPEYAALIHIGDIAYAKGSTYLWDQFGAVVEPVASRLAYMVGIGNHEYDYIVNGESHDLSGSDAALFNGWHPDGANFDDDSHGECGVPYAHRFHMNNTKDTTANPPFWYSFRVGLTHHVVLSSEHRCTPGAPMRKWLEKEFRNNVDRNTTPWLIVHLHRPLYCSEGYEGDHAVTKLLRDCFEDTLFANHVDLVFSGHYHAYERTCSVFRGECREYDGRAGAPTHIMIGSGGAELDDAEYLEAYWTRSRQQEYGHGRLHVFNESHAYFEFVRARDRTVTDATWFVSSHDWTVTKEVEGNIKTNVAALVDTSVDPCQDFYRFSCGGWLDTHQIPSDESMVEYAFDMAQDAMDATILQAIANDSTSLVGALYASCMDVNARNAVGAAPLQDALQSIAEARSKQELFRVAGRLARTGADFITNLAPDSSLQNSSQNVLWVSHADLTLDDEYYENPQVLAYVEQNLTQYAATILNLSGFELEKSEYDDYGEVVLGVEKQLIELQNYAELDPVSASVYYLFSYAEAAENYPLVFGAYVEGMQLLDDAPALTEQTDVAFLSIAYFEKAEELVSLVTLDALKLYIAFAHINNFAKYLSEPFVDARFEFFRGVMLGAKAPLPMEKICAANVVDLLPAHAGAAYVAHRNDMKETGDSFIAMLEDILDAMASNIKTLDWLDEQTRSSALAKLGSLEVMYVQPDSAQLEKEAEGLAKLDPTAFFTNVDLIYTAQFVTLAWAIGADVDRGKWEMSAASANAYYTPYTNQIVFPAGLMQKPFFDAGNSAAQIFGALGVVAGHEISHGFDNSGSNFDAKGNWNSWWTDTTEAEFEARAQCLADQYSSFYTQAEDGIQLVPVDGVKTLGENIADNGGLHVAFNAYKSRISRLNSGGSSSNDEDQLFFLSYAQTWCGKVRDETAVDSFLTNVHAVGEARVNGAAMNSAAFSSAFNCSAGAPMNPVSKCVLWSCAPQFTRVLVYKSLAMPVTTESEDVDDRERRQRYEETERELLAVLEAESMDESTRKRQLVGLFDRFRSEYTQLSVKLRESLRLQRRLMDKCMQMKNELVVCALKIKTTEQVQADEIKSLIFYRDECEYAWKQSALSQERERDAMRIIDDLKNKVEDLQVQVKTLVANSSYVPQTRRRPPSSGASELLLTISPLASPTAQTSKLQTLPRNPTATTVPTAKRTNFHLNAPSQSFVMPPLLSFDEWKSMTKVWCPATPVALGGPSRTAPTPSKDAIHVSELHQEITRCLSVPSLNPTPMERVSSPQQQQRHQLGRLSPATSEPTVRAGTAPILSIPLQSTSHTSQANTPIARRGGTPAIKRRLTLWCAVVDAALCRGIDIDDDSTVDDLKARLRGGKISACYTNEMTLYLAKADGQWLRTDDPNAVELLKGRLPSAVKAIMNKNNMMDPQRKLRDYSIPSGRVNGKYRYVELHLILDYPEYIKSRYRERRAARTPLTPVEGRGMAILSDSSLVDTVSMILITFGDSLYAFGGAGLLGARTDLRAWRRDSVDVEVGPLRRAWRQIRVVA
ncbi:unnamed protein product [Phytophthora lilii]|uniref:Purple acid phosphatase n=1 Tax=Phytophthora lilii TaxID=2077276 RepID=A0A9W6WP05_9STRA|nr:unnamed protein product [Phytophthora lilii]